MDKKNKVWLTALVLVVVIIAVFILMKDSSEENGQLYMPFVEEQIVNNEGDLNQGEAEEVDRVFFAEFLRANISDISPEKEVLGGKFYVTDIEWINNQTAIVDYEDGHIALRAEVKLSFTDETKSVVKVEHFKMMELPTPSGNY